MMDFLAFLKPLLGLFELVKPLLDYGLIAVLFVWLLKFTIKKQDEILKDTIQRHEDREKRILEESRDRESRLHSILETFSSKYDLIVEELKDIKITITKGKGE